MLCAARGDEVLFHFLLDFYIHYVDDLTRVCFDRPPGSLTADTPQDIFPASQDPAHSPGPKYAVTLSNTGAKTMAGAAYAFPKEQRPLTVGALSDAPAPNWDGRISANVSKYKKSPNATFGTSKRPNLFGASF